jgi:hypothetical protein
MRHFRASGSPASYQSTIGANCPEPEDEDEGDDGSPGGGAKKSVDADTISGQPVASAQFLTRTQPFMAKIATAHDKKSRQIATHHRED